LKLSRGSKRKMNEKEFIKAYRNYGHHQDIIPMHYKNSRRKRKEGGE
jgi:hypothetical protein